QRRLRADAANAGATRAATSGGSAAAGAPTAPTTAFAASAATSAGVAPTPIAPSPPAATASATPVPAARDPFTRAALRCRVLFLAALVAVVVPGIFPDLRPTYTTVHAGKTVHGKVEMSRAIMILMLAAAGLMMLLFRPDPDRALKGSVMRGGLVAIVCIL